MLTITVPQSEVFDEENQEFKLLPEITLELEHSLVSLSKWESIWKKPFLDGKDKTTPETFSYVRCMNLTPDVPDDVFIRLSRGNLDAITEYIGSSMTATWFNDDAAASSGSKSAEMITAEVIYYWLIALQIPFEVETWHLGRLITLVKVVNLKNAPPKKMGKRESMSRQKAINEARRKQLGTKG